MPKIELIQTKKLIGQRLEMSMQLNKTADLWKQFMPRRNEVVSKISSDFISLQVYPSLYFENYNSSTVFEKWALVEVSDFNNVSPDMETLILSEGLYAVFTYKKSEWDAQTFFKYIFTEWLPKSEYKLDNRPHFEVLGKKYSKDDPDSEEEVYIPVKLANH